MSKQNKNKYIRRSRCQCLHIDNQTVSSVQESTKSVAGVCCYNPFLQKISTKSSTTTKDNIIMSSAEGLYLLKGAIIENGIKYMMFPLHVLRCCIFGAIPAVPVDSKEHTETKHAEPCDENYEKNDEEEQITMECRKQRMTNENSNGRSLGKLQHVFTSSYFGNDSRDMSSPDMYCNEKNNSDKSNDEMMTADEDSDSSKDQWSNASNVMTMNVSFSYENIDNCISHTSLGEPMDISAEEHSFNKTQFPINISQDTDSSANVQSNVIRSKSMKSYTDKQDSNSFVDEEIARIFSRKCTFSEDAYSSSSFPKSFDSCKYRRSKQTRSFYNRRNSKYRNSYSIRPQTKKNETEQKKELSIKFAPTNEKKKLTFDEEKNEKHTEHKNEKKTQEKRSYRQNDPTKYKSRFSRIPVKNRKSKQNNVKYKETATQTDSIFLMDDDVEMVPVETKWFEQQCCRYATHKHQDINMNQELNDTADNGKSGDRRTRISSSSTSSSSIDLGFDEHISAISDTDIAAGQGHTKLLYNYNTINTFRTCTRHPPGFPLVPQNPPLTPCIHNPKYCILPFSKFHYDSNFHIKSMASVPPAPPPMRHLYYNYPEFMNLPTYIDSSNVIDNAIKDIYYR